MLSMVRRQEILDLLKIKKSVSVETLCQTFYISGATARRDLDVMSKEGLIKRTYGGAVLIDGSTSESPFMLRENENHDAKLQLAKAAARLVKTGQTLFMDSSTTVLGMAKQLKEVTGLTVITNGIITATRLSESGGITVYCAGGKLRDPSLSTVGITTKETISNYYADVVFLSCSGFDMRRGVTEANEEEAQIRREMIANAARVVLLCDSSKLENTYFSKVCDLDKLHVVITDVPLPQPFSALLQSHHVEQIITK